VRSAALRAARTAFDGETQSEEGTGLVRSGKKSGEAESEAP
jgi:hypothetical protein